MKYTQGQQWIIERKNKDGYIERIIYTGNIKLKPKGWRIIERL